MDRPIIVAGAGSIGCFVGGMLARAGRRVGLLARPRIIADIEKAGLHLSSFEGLLAGLPADALILSQDPSLLRDAQIVLVAVKSDDTPAMAKLIADHAPADAIIVSLQNGVGNVAVLRAALPGHRVLAGMVPFNVIAIGEGRFHRATSGDILLEADASKTVERLSVPGLTMKAHANMPGVQWGKLLVNLNNALNALSDLPLRDQLAQRPWRRLLADQMAEALTVMKVAGIKPLAMTPLPASFSPHILRLPDALFQAVAGQMLKIDPKARSSMWEDFQRGRRTEIDHLQGTIVGLAAKYGIAAPLSARIVALVRQAETDSHPPRLKPAQLRKA